MPVSRKPKPETVDEFIEQADKEDIIPTPTSTSKRRKSRRQSDIKKMSDQSDIKQASRSTSNQNDITLASKAISNQADITNTPIKISSQTAVDSGAEVISRAGSIQPLKLRIPEDLLADIDAIVEREKPKISRHTWILRTLYERVEQDHK